MPYRSDSEAAWARVQLVERELLKQLKLNEQLTKQRDALLNGPLVADIMLWAIKHLVSRGIENAVMFFFCKAIPAALVLMCLTALYFWTLHIMGIALSP